MEAVRFIKWWWNRRTSNEQILLTIPLFMIVFFSSLFMFGLKALFFFMLVGLGALISALFYQIFKAFNKEWNVYKQEKERDAQRIVDRLRGY